MSFPKISLHKPSGRARVWIRELAQHVYLGRYGSAEGHRQYDQLMRLNKMGRVNYWITGCWLQTLAGADVSVSQLCNVFIKSSGNTTGFARLLTANRN